MISPTISPRRRRRPRRGRGSDIAGNGSAAAAAVPTPCAARPRSGAGTRLDGHGVSGPRGQCAGPRYTAAAADRGLTSEDLAATRSKMRARRPDPAADRRLPTGAAPTPAVPALGGAADGPATRPATAPRRGWRGGSSRTGSGRRRRRAGAAGAAARRWRHGCRGDGDRRHAVRVPAAVPGCRPGYAAVGRRQRVRDDHVRADLGVGDAADLDELDDETLARRRGRERKGRPVGRYLMCVHVGADGHPDRRARGPQPRSSTTCRRRPTTSPRSTATSTSAGSRTCCPAWRRPSSTSARPRTPCSTAATSHYDRDDVEERAQPRIEQLLKTGQTIMLPGHQEPDRHQGRPPHPGGVAAGPLRGPDPEQPDTYGISKRLPDDERKRLRRILDEVRPAGHG